MQTLESLIFLEKAAMKFRNLQINEILNTDPNHNHNPLLSKSTLKYLQWRAEA